MKKRYLFSSLFALGIVLAGCSNNNSSVTSITSSISSNNSSATSAAVSSANSSATSAAVSSSSAVGGSEKSTELYGTNKDGEVIKLENVNLLFKNNSKIPYINLDDGVKLMSALRSANLDDKKYNVKIEKKDGEVIISNEVGAKCVINKANQTLSYDDYDKFTSVVPDTQKPLSILTLKKNNKALKLVESTYTAGKALTIDLKPYSKLDIYQQGDKYYLPLSVFNSLLYNTGENCSLGYNSKELYLINGNNLVVSLGMIKAQSDFGEKFAKGFTDKTLSSEFQDYYYQSLCLDFNTNYGLKGKFTSFEDYLQIYKNNIINSDIKTVDKYTAAALTYLNDGHTALTEFSFMYEYGDNTVEAEIRNPISAEHASSSEKFEALKKSKNIKEGLSYEGTTDTIFVSFDKFTNIDNDLLYLEETGDDLNLDDLSGLDNLPGLDFAGGISDVDASDTSVLFNKLYKEVTKEGSTVKNIVIDLTTNEGGASDGLVYALSTILGDVPIDLTNTVTGARNHQVFHADLNADKVIDAKDKGLIELGKNIYFVDSRYTFSSANAMSVIAKNTNANIVTLGDKTGGGPCAVRQNITTIGSMIASSSLTAISKLENNKYVHIDAGVEADYKFLDANNQYVDENKLLDRQYIINNLNNWKKK